MIIFDSSYLLALRDKLDTNNKRAIAISKKIEGRSVLYLEDVLKEVQTVISIRCSCEEGFKWVDSIYEFETDLDRQYSLSVDEYFKVLNFWRSLKSNNLSFVDAEILYLAMKYKFPVISFDKELLSYLDASLCFGN